MKNFWKYFTITVLLLLGLCCVGILYMFFVGAPLFKFKYISNNKDYVSKSYNLTELAYPIETVSLTTDNFDVSVEETEKPAISLKVHNGLYGFVLVSNSQLKFREELVLGSLKFSVEEPHGFAAKGRSSITLYIPKEAQLNLVLTNNRAKTEIDLPTAKIQNLSYTTSSGDLNVARGSVLGDIDFKLGRSTATISNVVAMSENKVNLSMTSGCLNGKDIEFGTINLLKSTSGVVRAKSCTSLIGKNENAGGSVTADQVDNINFVGGDTDIKIKTLNFGTIDLKKSGDVEITTIQGSSRINTTSGKISITTANSFELFVNSQKGDISVKKSFGHVDATTVSGNIDVTFDDEAKEFGTSENSARRLYATTNTGKITARGVENTEIKIKDDGQVSLYMKDVVGENLISAGKGSVYVEVKEEGRETAPSGVAKYRLYWKTVSGSVSVNLANTHPLGTGGDRDKEKEIYVNDTTQKTTNSLIINSTSGSIRVRDTITRNY